MSKWYAIRAAANDAATAEIDLFDEIGGWGITAAAFARDLKGLGEVKAINLNINSLGGGVFDGIAVASLLKNHPATVTAKVMGIAASIASVIAVAADEVEMASGSFMMIHDPAGVAWGTADDMRDLADVLDKVKGSLAGFYVAKTGMDEDEVRQMMASETWLTAEEAVEKGFADRVGKAMKVAARADDVDLLKNLNAPADVLSALTRRPAAPPSQLENNMSEKEEKPAGTEAAAPENPTPAADPAVVVDLCVAAGVPAMASALIKEGLSIEAVKNRVEGAKDIKAAVERARKVCPAIEANAADTFLAGGVSVAEAKAALMDKIAAMQSPEIVNTVTGNAPPTPTKGGSLTERAWNNWNKRGAAAGKE